eukprot:TRINITY_DN9258_c0_g1_i1.p1 TRINITY_DN9258_c0_g1~~TRINITY_DN9258_c0_g1_i1.p1  ORF type:complete len:713 (-),score=70.62 TRINITY_DN9258_c0_g1_i1:32-2170(-)
MPKDVDSVASFEDLLHKVTSDLEATRHSLSLLVERHRQEAAQASDSRRIVRSTGADTPIDLDIPRLARRDSAQLLDIGLAKRLSRSEWHDFEIVEGLNDVVFQSSVVETSTTEFDPTDNVEYTRPHGWYTLHPRSGWRLAWDFLGICGIIFDAITLPLAVFQLSDVQGWEIQQWIVTVYWTLDIFLNFRTGYYDGPSLVMDVRDVTLHYVRGWFCVDIILVISEWTARFLHTIDGFNFARWSRVLKASRVLRTLKLPTFIKTVETKLGSPVLRRAVNIANMTILLAVALHLMTCGWYLMGSHSNEGWVFKELGSQESITLLEKYFASARWCLAQINGRTDQKLDRTIREKVYTTGCGVFTIIFVSSLIGCLTTGMLEVTRTYRENTKLLSVFERYCERHRLSQRVIFFAREYMQHRQEVQLIADEEGFVLSVLPQQLKSDLLYEIRRHLIGKYPFFRTLCDSSRSAFRAICSNATTTVRSLSSELVFEKGEACTRMLFVEEGELRYCRTPTFKKLMTSVALSRGHAGILRAVTSHSRSVYGQLHGHIVLTGMWLSELALWIYWKTHGELFSVTNATLFAVEFAGFVGIIKQFDDLYARCAVFAKLVAREIEDKVLSDLSHEETQDFCELAGRNMSELVEKQLTHEAQARSRSPKISKDGQLRHQRVEKVCANDLNAWETQAPVSAQFSENSFELHPASCESEEVVKERGFHL